jgi:large-conductance mechanosensitive channel
MLVGQVIFGLIFLFYFFKWGTYLIFSLLDILILPNINFIQLVKKANPGATNGLLSVQNVQNFCYNTIVNTVFNFVIIL